MKSLTKSLLYTLLHSVLALRIWRYVNNRIMKENIMIDMPSVCLVICNILFSFIFLSGTACLAQSSDRHYCKDGYFSFIPPDNWRAVNEETMSGKLKNELHQIGKDRDAYPRGGTLMVICEPTAGRSSGDQLILIYRSYFEEESEIELENDWLSSESKIRKYWLSERNKMRIQQKLYSSDPRRTPDIEIKDAKYCYQQIIHTAFEKVKGKKGDVNFVRITAIILGSQTKTTLFCQFQESSNIDADKLIGQIAESFRYDIGYEFGAPNASRTDLHTRTMRRATGSLMQICIFSLVMFAGLFLFRIVSGNRIPVTGMAVATISGALVFQIMTWLVWEAGFMPRSEFQGYFPFLAVLVVMTPIIWKWSKSEVSFQKSALAVGSLLMLMSSSIFVLMFVATAGMISLIPFVIILILTIFMWRRDI